MEYEKLLESAYEQVKPCEACERFEIRKVEGHHEGNKTVISNFSQITSCLRRNCDHMAKFLSRELAIPVDMEGDRLILWGKIASKNINDKIEKYVSRFVTCPKCGKPDTELIDENGNWTIRCLACGTRRSVAEK